jgi:hypothetical protein
MFQKYLFIIINILIGPTLLYTYYRGVSQNREIASQLWGGVPQSITPYIVTSMFIGAFGYFFFTYYLIFEVNHKNILIFNKYNFSIFIILYLLILIPSSLWIDLSINYLINGNPILWKLIVLVLYTVGIASIILLLCLINIRPSEPSLIYKLSIVGCCFFAFHTMFLDGLLWTFFFHK